MTEISFTINGNQENPLGNPIPFQRALNNHWRAASKRYMDWQAFVRSVYFQQIGKAMPIITSDEDGKPKTYNFQRMKPIQLRHTEAEMHVRIYWHDRTHGDADNVFKGIADALFENDKLLTAGSFTSELAQDKRGRVEVRIEIKN